MPTIPPKLLAASIVLALAPWGCDPQGPDEPGLDDPAAEPEVDEPAPGAHALVGAVDPAGAAADCCDDHFDRGCDDLAVQSCVCAADPFCCNNSWDAQCVGEVDWLGCGTCDTTMPCCEARTTGGCEVAPVQACVCAADPYCCTTAWDSLCVDEVQWLGCGTCNPVDLVITGLQIPSMACPGQDIGPSVELEVTNVGTAATGGSFHVGWYLSDNAILDGSDDLLLGGRDSVAALGAGASTSVNIGFNEIPPGATHGARHIIVAIDELGSVVETDEDDNVLARPITIGEECAPTLEWAHRMGSGWLDSMSPGAGVAVDAEGNVYVLGYGGPDYTDASPIIELGEGPMVISGPSDVFLVSYDVEGAYRWSRLLSTDVADQAGGVGVDAEGNVYVAYQSGGEINYIGVAAPGSGHLFIRSYTSTGALRWSQSHQTDAIHAQDLAVEDDGDLVVTGYYMGVMSLGGDTLGSLGKTDMFVLALDTNGDHRWSRSIGDLEHEWGRGVAVDGSGGAVVVGHFSGTVAFGTDTPTSAGNMDGMVVRLGATGATQWVRHFGSTSQDDFEDVALDASGNIYAIGSFVGTVDLGGGPHAATGSFDVIVASYDPTGSLRWSRGMGGAGSERGHGIALDADGHPIVTGAFTSIAADFGGTTLMKAGSSVSATDAFYASHDAATGTVRWAHRLGGADRADGRDLAVSPSGALILGGTFKGTMPVMGTDLVSADGEQDVFVVSIAL